MNVVTYNDADPEVDAATLLPHHRKDSHTNQEGRYDINQEGWQPSHPNRRTDTYKSRKDWHE